MEHICFFSSGEKPNLSINAKRFCNKITTKFFFTFPHGAL